MQVKKSNSWVKDKNGEVWSPDNDLSKKDFYKSHIMRCNPSEVFGPGLQKIIPDPREARAFDHMCGFLNLGWKENRRYVWAFYRLEITSDPPEKLVARILIDMDDPTPVVDGSGGYSVNPQRKLHSDSNVDSGNFALQRCVCDGNYLYFLAKMYNNDQKPYELHMVVKTDYSGNPVAWWDMADMVDDPEDVNRVALNASDNILLDYWDGSIFCIENPSGAEGKQEVNVIYNVGSLWTVRGIYVDETNNYVLMHDSEHMNLRDADTGELIWATSGVRTKFCIMGSWGDYILGGKHQYLDGFDKHTGEHLWTIDASNYDSCTGGYNLGYNKMGGLEGKDGHLYIAAYCSDWSMSCGSDDYCKRTFIYRVFGETGEWEVKFSTHCAHPSNETQGRAIDVDSRAYLFIRETSSSFDSYLVWTDDGSVGASAKFCVKEPQWLNDLNIDYNIDPWDQLLGC